MDEKITAIEDRNRKVALDKAWETSVTRRGFIASITYAVAVVFMHNIGVSDPFLSALVPTGGYILSTLSLSVLKKQWIKKNG